MIAGTVLPLQRAEELIGTLPGVVSVRIVPTESGGVGTIHVLTTGETAPKAMVRNVESALMAHLGMRVDHRKVSVATTNARPSPAGGVSAEAAAAAAAAAVESSASAAPAVPAPSAARAAAGIAAAGVAAGRTMYFDDVELHGSRSKGVTCRVTLRRGDQTFVGEATRYGGDHNRAEVAARAAMEALAGSAGSVRARPRLEGCVLVEAFERTFVFVGVTVQLAREMALVTGSAEVKESMETAAVLAVLDATNRWVAGQAT